MHHSRTHDAPTKGAATPTFPWPILMLRVVFRWLRRDLNWLGLLSAFPVGIVGGWLSWQGIANPFVGLLIVASAVAALILVPRWLGPKIRRYDQSK